MDSPHVYYITGTPGVGKTKVGAILARQIGAVFIDLNEMIKKKKMYTAYDRSSQAFIADSRKVSPFLRNVVFSSRIPVVISSHLVYPLPSVPRLAIIVLRLSPLKLMKRLKNRGYNKRKIAENVSAELLDLAFHEAYDEAGRRLTEIDTTGLSAKEVVYLIRKLVKRGAGSGKKPKTDWIRILEKQKVLSVVTDFLSSTFGS